MGPGFSSCLISTCHLACPLVVWGRFLLLDGPVRLAGVIMYAVHNHLVACSCSSSFALSFGISVSFSTTCLQTRNPEESDWHGSASLSPWWLISLPCRAAALRVHTSCFCSHWRLPWCLGRWPGCFGWKYLLARCLVSWRMSARLVPRAVFGLGQGQLRPSWPAGPRPGAGQEGRRCPARSARSAHTPATAAAHTIHPTTMRGAGRACARACWEAPGAAHNGWQPQSVYAVRSPAWPAFQRTIGGLRGRVSVLDTQSGLY